MRQRNSFPFRIDFAKHQLAAFFAPIHYSP
jgi:hypothetical protein